MVTEGTFRLDLFYRINVMMIKPRRSPTIRKTSRCLLIIS